METITLNFKASGQTLTADANPQRYASNTVNYIQAVFDLDDNWKSFDSVRAVWHNEFACISMVLDGSGACAVPHEVLSNLDEVIVNLVGSDVDGEELVDRMTTYPLRVAIIDAHARICGTETAEVTPSQFEQYIAIVEQIVGTVKDIDHTELTDDYCLIIYYSDGTNSGKLGPIRGATGATGNGIVSAVLNADYTLTLTYDNGDSDTVGPIRGAQGKTGNGIESVYLTETHGAVKTYTILFTDGTTTTFDVTDGEVTLAQLSAVLPTDTASGAIASFPDGSDLFDYLSCIVNIEPVQDLHGYDKPWVGGGGKNKINAPDVVLVSANYLFNLSGLSIASGTYTFSFTGATTNVSLAVVGENGDIINQTVTVPFTFTANEKIVGIRCYTSITGAYKEFQLESGSSKTTFEPYSNICPITGWTGCKVSKYGKNLFNPNSTSKEWVNTNSQITTASDCKANRIKVNSGEKITLSNSNSASATNILLIAFCDANENVLSRNVASASGVYKVTATAPANTAFAICAFYTWSASANQQVEYGGTQTDYEAYAGATYPVSWQTEAGTVYGGTVDVVTGVLTAYPYYASYNGETLVGPWVSSMDEYVQGTTPTTGAQVVDLGGTPTTYQLTPTQIHALLGQNNVWADCGNVEVQYKADVQRWVEKMLDA